MKNINQLLKKLKKESATPDPEIIREILEIENCEEHLREELELLLSRTRPTIERNREYLINLGFLLGELRSSESFYPIMKVFQFPEYMFLKIYGELRNYLWFTLSRCGKGKMGELYQYIMENLDSAEKVAVAVETICVMTKKTPEMRDEGVNYLKNIICNRELPIGLRMVAVITSSVQGIKDLKKIVDRELPYLEEEQDIITRENIAMWRKNPSGEFTESDIFQVYRGIKKISQERELLPELIFEQEEEKTTLVDQYIAGNLQRQSQKVGRNEPCPCGSGKKYKKCCGK
ncbi:MAG: YecA family protein [Fusobacteriaceae bacterium]